MQPLRAELAQRRRAEVERLGVEAEARRREHRTEASRARMQALVDEFFPTLRRITAE